MKHFIVCVNETDPAVSKEHIIKSLKNFSDFKEIIPGVYVLSSLDDSMDSEKVRNRINRKDDGESRNYEIFVLRISNDGAWSLQSAISDWLSNNL